MATGMVCDSTNQEPLAIVGIGCRLPGDVCSARELWTLLCEATDATREVPETRWHAARFHDPSGSKIGKMVTRRGGFLTEIDQFDPQFFGISPREAHSLDPQQRLLLQTTWEALEDAGIPPDGLAGTDVGVFVGGFTLDYQLLQNHGRGSRYRFKAHSATGMMMTMLANRISHAFDFRGPSMSVDTACSSSLVAVHLAAQSIWSGESRLAVVGGVNIMGGPNTAIAESTSGFLSPDGRSKAFDDSADGYARGEGGAVVVLKPLTHALRDGDDIYAQILGTAVSQDGHTDGITVPREDAQHAAITTALHRAGVQAADVGYVEAHGTGTPLGDPIEIRALASALTSERPTTRPLVVGSVKTNIGHLEAGAGVAGLIKAALVAKEGYIPATVHFHTPTRYVSLAELNIEISGEGRPFPEGERRVVGVNSFGFGGTNAHVVLAEPPTRAQCTSERDGASPPMLLPISARSEEALAATARRLGEFLDAHPGVTLGSLAYTLGQRRAHLSHRDTVIADSIDEARQQLRGLAEGRQILTARTATTAPKVAFVCTGMGPQWWRMCRGLLDAPQAFPAFTESIARTDRELSRHADWSLIEELRRDEMTSRMSETQIAQPANFAIQVALAEQLAQFGITPDAVIGHSAGEVAAHHLAGLLSFEQAVEVIYHRSRLQQRTSGLGRMLAVGTDADALVTALTGPARDEIGRKVSVAAINSPSAITLGGDSDILHEIATQLDTAGIFHRFLAGNVPYHTHYMDSVREDLLSALDGLSSERAALPLYSTVTGERLERYEAGAAYWWQNTRASVLFEPALRRMLDDGYTQFLELGPHPVLAASIFETAGTQRISVTSTQHRQQDDVRTILGSLGELHCHGHRVAWDALNPADGARLLKLPSYPWQTKRYWNDTQEATELLFYKPVHPLLGQAVSAVHPTWEAELSTVLNPFLADHRVQGSVVLPGAVYIEMALAAARETYGSSHSVDNLVLQRAVILDDTCDPLLRTTLNKQDGTLEFAAFTANADGDLKWVITATAELNILPAQRVRTDPADDTVVTSIGRDDFYARTETLGFDYGAAFRSVTGVTAGHDWAVAELVTPITLTDDVDDYHFHPALIDGAFQTLFGAPFLGQEESDDPYLPTRIDRCMVYGRPEAHMMVRADVVSASAEQVECNLVISDRTGRPLVVIEGFTVQSLATSSRMSPDRIDRGILEIRWSPMDVSREEREPFADERSWLVLDDDSGFGRRLADHLRAHGQRAHTVGHREVDLLTESGDGWLINPRCPDQMAQLIAAHLESDQDLAGIINCWPLDITGPDADHHLGAFTVLRLVKTLAENDTLKPLMYFVTSNTQPTPGRAVGHVDQATLWGLGRVIGHQELAEYWGGLIDIDIADSPEQTVARICSHVLEGESEDQIAIRGGTTFVPRLRPCATLTSPFPTKLTPDGTYVVTGGAGALGRIAATYLAERGARHVTLLGRRAFPARDQWSTLRVDDPHRATVETVRAIEKLGATVTVCSVDITDAGQLQAWLHDHERNGGRPIRGIIHAAGSVNDQLLVNMSENDFAAVADPKITGTKLLHNAFEKHDLEFFVMFGSAGSTIASPGQGNYAAANAFLDAFAHHRRAQGLPALTIGWGPWSVGMVEELGLEKMYAQRGIDLITPAVGVRILDRLINQDVSAVVAISADWNRARQAGLGAHLPLMFTELQTSDKDSGDGDSGASILSVLASTPQSDRLAVVADHIRALVAAVFDCGEDDFASDAMLEDIGLDSMMAMEFRVRINMLFSIDLPVLEILKGVSVNSLADRILGELHAIHGQESATSEAEPSPVVVDADVDLLVDGLSDAELLELLGELEAEGGNGAGEQP
ncbi:type I polyketide synthase [Mycolicibacterium sp. BiH015]|uniref:type I polyketide synthase n=1 Tax=Mycolicibacterium sp. BiH015 TaxID=3018808 RepID=UPI0022E187C5|nr:type I polyketide synthase [Mycolicibacterium sp. BiH015]MDA2893869.1 type I polyketide synthase [Mycolicibacterium sp. BiH015]